MRLVDGRNKRNMKGRRPTHVIDMNLLVGRGALGRTLKLEEFRRART